VIPLSGREPSAEILSVSEGTAAQDLGGIILSRGGRVPSGETRFLPPLGAFTVN